MNVDDLPTWDEIRKTWQVPISTVVVYATNNTGCSKCLGAGVVYYQWCKEKGGWTQMWAKCDLCNGKGHA